MRILAIETSCDDTAVAILEGSETATGATFTLLGNGTFSQVALHQAYGGVYPTLAKREHAKNLVPLLDVALKEAGLYVEGASPTPSFGDLLSREKELENALMAYLPTTVRPEIDAIAVTRGPGLAPALWVGVNFANALAKAWDIPIVPINHMEGHMLAGLLVSEEPKSMTLPTPSLPLLSLLISGGHTELVLMHEWLSYTLVGKTRDDAVGEAFDKVARMLDLPYPGGPEIARLASLAREKGKTSPFSLPRPMLQDASCDFSFSGLKTAVLYLLKKQELSGEEREQLAQEFEDTIVEVLWAKTARALRETNAKLLALGGGVSANAQIRSVFKEKIEKEFPHVKLRIPPPYLTTDNAVMIGIAGYFRSLQGETVQEVRANANLTLA